VSQKNPSSWKSISIAAEAERVIMGQAEASLVDGAWEIVSQIEPRCFSVPVGASRMELRRFDWMEVVSRIELRRFEVIEAVSRIEPRRFDLIEGARVKVSRIEPRRLD
jgi:hypothetical protein